MGIYIGTASASADFKDSPIDRAIARLATNIAKKRSRGEIPESPSLDVNFLLPGKFEKADFDGMQMGGYTRQNNTLFFECAVPEHIIDSDYADVYLEVVISDVIKNAADYFNEISVDFDKDLWANRLQGIIAPPNSLANPN